MEGSIDQHPRVFVSYSWTSDDHVAWVIQLAERLTADGVRVTIDRWDLHEGQDKYAFMEKMVTDSKIDPVLVVCDAAYAEKADAKTGGVGTESQIISPEVYREVSQEKFIPLVVERDSSNQELVPTFLRGRVYFDFSRPELEEDAYERLLRNLYGKPQYRRPPLGQAPSFVTDDDQSSVVTTSRARRLLHFIEQGRPINTGLLRDYIDGLLKAFCDERIEPPQAEEAENFDELVMASLARWEPYRGEWLEVLRALARYDAMLGVTQELHSFFERVGEQLGWPEGAPSWNDMWDDNLSFFARELFVLTSAELVESRQLSSLSALLERPYLVRQRNETRYQSFVCFDTSQPSLDQLRNRRLELRRVSLATDLLKERCDRAGPRFGSVIDVEILLFARSVLMTYAEGSPEELRDIWWPRSLIYRHRHPTWGLAARLRSRRVFEEFAAVLGVRSLEELRDRVESLPETGPLVQMHFTRLSAQSLKPLLGLEKLGRLP